MNMPLIQNVGQALLYGTVAAVGSLVMIKWQRCSGLAAAAGAFISTMLAYMVYNELTGFAGMVA